MATASFFVFLFFVFVNLTGSQTLDFIFHGFQGASSNQLSLDGSAIVTDSGVLQLTDCSKNLIGHAFYSSPIHIFNNQSASAATASASFSTTFVFSIVNQYPGNGGGHGLAFIISPSKQTNGARDGQFLGLSVVNEDHGKLSKHVFAVEFDTVQDAESFGDINSNHVGIDVNSLQSKASKPAAYYVDNTTKAVDLKLESGKPIQAWIDYDGVHKVVHVTISPLSVPKPSQPLLSHSIDLSGVLEEPVYVGFSSSTAKLFSSHYILGWSFQTNGLEQPLDISQLPSPPHRTSGSKHKAIMIGAASSVIALVLIVIAITTSLYLVQRAKYAETPEDWELNLPRRIPYRDLYVATKGFKDTMVLGSGGLGCVYKGVLPTTGEDVAVKRIANISQGVEEFVSDIAKLGSLRHGHLVHLQGWCKRKGDLFLVSEFMPNSTLDAFLYDRNKSLIILTWEHRFKIVKGVASALLHLHEDWEQVIVHRNIKASNILLDDEMNAKLGDFGLSKLYEYRKNNYIAQIVGTLGYVAPELSRTGNASTSSDVFAYGVLLLEVACGRRPINENFFSGPSVLLDCVRECSKKGRILEAADPKLQYSYAVEEMELVLMLGLLCSRTTPEARPTMRQDSGDLALRSSSPAFQQHHYRLLSLDLQWRRLIIADQSSNITGDLLISLDHLHHLRFRSQLTSDLHRRTYPASTIISLFLAPIVFSGELSSSEL
ncbi:hypothetical protein HHK36_016141 [Tetracentron sinense]|uniref:non-specific serine/threonine protein kinase n=1 Tax=Tetracentron sinense TaxID=13715 RepID=A0A835DBN6_TETSI|nr:hypothetical protein HHK36_016141 [Tetracentron sinense]